MQDSNAVDGWIPPTDLIQVSVVPSVERIEDALRRIQIEWEEHRLKFPNHAGLCRGDWIPTWLLAAKLHDKLKEQVNVK